MLAIIITVEVIGCVAIGWVAEDIRSRRAQAKRDRVNDDVDAYIESLEP